MKLWIYYANASRGQLARHYYLQLSASIVHRCLSIGKYCKFMGQEEVTVSLRGCKC